MTCKKISVLAFLSLIILSACKKDEDSATPKNPIQNGSNHLVVDAIQRNSGSEKSISVGGKTYITGYTQLSNNQDAYVICKNGSEIMWARYYDKSPDDSRGEALAFGGNNLIVAFSCTGGNTDFTATPEAFQMSYGAGGGPKILYLARINAQTGSIENATFIGCKLNNGNTNTIRIQDDNPQPITFTNEGSIRIMATKAYDRADGRLTPGNGNDEDCLISGGSWEGIFSLNMQLMSGNCFPD